MLTSEYDQCIKSMFKLRRFGIKLGLSTIDHLLNELGSPHNNFQSIHIAGTNGKGSVASALSAILQNAGYCVGLYTSPHLVKFNERIQINNVQIEDDAVLNLWKTVKSINLKTEKITFFEFSTAMALYEFKRKKVDFAIIETGMGGRLDATNIISPIMSVITNISLEHKEYLGTTIEQISSEKAGIIKPNIPVISGVMQENAIAIIKKTTNKTNSELLLKKRDFKTRKKQDGSFSYFGKYNTWNNMQTNLVGNHQIDNAAVALASCEILNKKYITLPLKHIRSGLCNNKLQGRLEVILESPYIFVDGAHNLMAAKKIKKFIKKNLSNKKVTLIVGILDDKPYKSMLKELMSVCSHTVVTKPKTKRAIPINKMEKAAKLFSNNVTAISNVGDALIKTIHNNKPNDAICLAGSLYVVGEAKKIIASVAQWIEPQPPKLDA